MHGKRQAAVEKRAGHVGCARLLSGRIPGICLPLRLGLCALLLSGGVQAGAQTATRLVKTDGAPRALAGADRKEAQAANILKKAAGLKRAGKYPEASETLRDLLPLCPELPVAVIIQAAETLDSILVRWQTVVTAQRDKEQKTSANQKLTVREKYAAVVKELREAEGTVEQLEKEKAQAEQAVRKFERGQAQGYTLGAEYERGQLNQQCEACANRLEAEQAKVQHLTSEEARLRNARNSQAVYQHTSSTAEPWKLYAKLQDDFKDALKEARQRDAQRR